MTIHQSPEAFGYDAFLSAHQNKEVLRFITCGSVDDGKSTLIGRLLYDSKMIFEDQLAALEADSRRVGTQGQEIDFALLVDGLAARLGGAGAAAGGPGSSPKPAETTRETGGKSTRDRRKRHSIRCIRLSAVAAGREPIRAREARASWRAENPPVADPVPGRGSVMDEA